MIDRLIIPYESPLNITFEKSQKEFLQVTESTSQYSSLRNISGISLTSLLKEFFSNKKTDSAYFLLYLLSTHSKIFQRFPNSFDV
jgi:hypothetical protein